MPAIEDLITYTKGTAPKPKRAGRGASAAPRPAKRVKVVEDDPEVAASIPLNLGGWDIVIQIRPGLPPNVKVTPVVGIDPERDGPAVRTEGCTALALKHPKPCDRRLLFVESTHKYYWDGKMIPKSVTGFIKDKFGGPPFNGKLIARQCMRSWQKKYNAGTSTEYGPIIEKLNAGTVTFDEAVDLVLQSWVDNREKGSRVHAELEIHLNKYPDASWRTNSFIHADSPPDLIEDLKQLDMWAQSPITEHLVPIRTELSTVWLDKKGEPVLAGQCDVWMQNTKTGKYIGVDLKRVNKKYALDTTEKPRGSHKYAEHPALKKLLHTHYSEYSLQLSLYAEMIARTHGWDVGDEMYILRVHGEERAIFQWSKCLNLRAAARLCLEEIS
jgi:hypothetical protein